VAEGTYEESVDINVEGLTLEGPNAGIAGDSDDRGDEAVLELSGTTGIEPTADDVTIDGFTITGNSTQLIGNNQASGIGYEVSNNVFEDFDETAVRPQSAAGDVVVTDNLFDTEDATQGFQAAADVTAEFEGNVFESGVAGIGVAGDQADAVEYTIEDNEFRDQSVSVYTQSGADVDFPSFQGNDFEDSDSYVDDNAEAIVEDSEFGLEDIEANNDFDPAAEIVDNRIVPETPD